MVCSKASFNVLAGWEIAPKSLLQIYCLTILNNRLIVPSNQGNEIIAIRVNSIELECQPKGRYSKSLPCWICFVEEGESLMLCNSRQRFSPQHLLTQTSFYHAGAKGAKPACHYKKYGCCMDDKTPCTGPNYEGCQNSKPGMLLSSLPLQLQ